MEKWSMIPGYDAYEVGSFGNVRSWKTGEAVLLKKAVSTVGYPMVSLCVGGRPDKIYVHHLVAQAFVGERPDGFYVDHIDENKENNCASNLQYLSARDNSVKSQPVRDLPTGVIYLSRCKTKPYRANARLNGKKVYLGFFATPEEASQAYQSAVRQAETGGLGC